MSELDHPEPQGVSGFLTGKELISRLPVDPPVARALHQLYPQESDRLASVTTHIMQKYAERAEDAVLAWTEIGRQIPVVGELLTRNRISIIERPQDRRHSGTGEWWEVENLSERDFESQVVRERRIGIQTMFRDKNMTEPVKKNEVQVQVNLDGDERSNLDGSIEMLVFMGKNQPLVVPSSHNLFLPYAGIALAGSVKVMGPESMNRALEILKRYSDEAKSRAVNSQQ